jgi:hypothetical protein
MTLCNEARLLFPELGGREVVAGFDDGKVTSDAGGLLLRQVEAKFHFIERFAQCFTDHRDPDLIEHTLPELLKQRIFGLCLGYEDLNDHEQLRYDPLLAVLVGKKDPSGDGRARARDRGKALAGKSTLNRLELTPVRANANSRYKKIVAHLDAMQAFLVEAFLGQYLLPPERIILDVDATDDPLHGHQLGRFFHGYYDCYCYLPQYVFCGDHPLLRASGEGRQPPLRGDVAVRTRLRLPTSSAPIPGRGRLPHPRRQHPPCSARLSASPGPGW